MEGKTKQVLAYEWMIELAAVPLNERHHVMKGAELFFLLGWPSNHFTVGMAGRAGKGLVPPVYKGLGSEEDYFQFMKTSSVMQ